MIFGLQFYRQCGECLSALHLPLEPLRFTSWASYESTSKLLSFILPILFRGLRFQASEQWSRAVHCVESLPLYVCDVRHVSRVDATRVTVRESCCQIRRV